MDVDRLVQTCGNCGATNAPDAVVCAACGVVLAAYASVTTAPLAIEPPTRVDAPGTTLPATGEGKETASITSRDWRSLFEHQSSVDIPEIEHQRPLAAPAEARPEMTRPGRTAPVTRQTPSSVETHQPSASQRERSVPAQGTTAHQAGTGRPVDTRRSPASNPPVAASMSTGRVGRRAANRAFRGQPRKPITIMYAGIALLLGGCVLSLLLAMLIENSSAIGFAFLCTVPVGLILIVVGYIRMMMRREGRSPK